MSFISPSILPTRWRRFPGMEKGQIGALIVCAVFILIISAPVALAIAGWTQALHPFGPLTERTFWRATALSIAVATLQCAGSLSIAASGGYVLAFGQSASATWLRRGVLLAAALPPAALLLGGFKLIGFFGAMNTVWAVVVPGWMTAGGILACAAAYRRMDTATLAAAELDGASELQAWWHVALPAVRPTLAALVTWNLVMPWHQLLWPGVVWWDGSHQTLSLWLAERTATASGTVSAGPAQIAVACCTAIPLAAILIVVTSRSKRA